MPDRSDSEIASAVAKLDNVILTLLNQREQLVRLTAAPQIETVRGVGIARALTSAAPDANRIAIERYAPFCPGLWVGFEEGAETKVSLRQHPKVDPLLSPPDHHYWLELSVEESSDSSWISLESELDALPYAETCRLNVGIKARSNIANSIALEVSLPSISGTEIRLPLGAMAIRPDYAFHSHWVLLDRATLEQAKPDGRFRLLFFLPRTDNFDIHIAFFSAFVSPGRL